MSNARPAAAQALGRLLERTSIIWKTAFGSVAAWGLSTLTGSHHPYLAPLTLILCLQTTTHQSLRFALYRSVGTVAGVLLIGFFAKELPLTVWTLGLLLLFFTALLKLVCANDTLIHQVALSILFVLYFEHHSQGYAWDRAKDTVIGSLVAVVLTTLVVPVNETNKTKREMQQVVQDFASLAERVADRLRRNELNAGSLERDLAVLFGALQHLSQSFAQAKKGLPFNFYETPSRTLALQWRLQCLQEAYTHFAALGEALTERMTEADRKEWVDHLHALAAEIRAFPIEDGRADASSGSASGGMTRDDSKFSVEGARYEAHKLSASLLRARVLATEERSR